MKVDNFAIIAALCAAYTAHTAAQVVILGYDIGGTVFAAEIPVNIVLTEFAGISMTSDSIPVKRMRVKPLTKKSAVLFNSFSPFPVCSFAELTARAQSEHGGNRGEAFEKIITEYYHGTAAAENTPFWISGDFRANNTEYQVKFCNATIVHEKHLTALQAIK